MHRFYCPNTDFSPTKISIINPAEIHHLRHVLRLSPGEKIGIFNGQGEEITGSIESVSAMEVRVAVLERRIKGRTDIFITLACAVPKKAKFEWIIEKCTELGVDEIIPMRTARTEVVLNKERMERKNSRYQSVAVNAAKQSARTTVPIVHAQRPFKDVLAMFAGPSLKIIFALYGQRQVLREVLSGAKNPGRIVYLVGPEGDFTSQEVEAACSAGFLPVTLGQTTLKVDTAAITAVGFSRLFF